MAWCAVAVVNWRRKEACLFRVRWFVPLGLALLVLLACSTVASTVTSTVTPTVGRFTLGAPVRVQNTWRVIVKSVKATKGTSQDVPPPSGQVYLVIQVSMQNISGTTQNTFDVSWLLRDDATKALEPESDMNSVNAAWGGEVRAGDQAAGPLIFRTPTSVHTYLLSVASTGTPFDSWAEWVIHT